jgi:hypothetical protein
MRHNAPTGVTPDLQKLDPADLGEAFQGALHSAARAADAVHDRGDCRLGHLREKVEIVPNPEICILLEEAVDRVRRQTKQD